MKKQIVYSLLVLFSLVSVSISQTRVQSLESSSYQKTTKPDPKKSPTLKTVTVTTEKKSSTCVAEKIWPKTVTLNFLLPASGTSEKMKSLLSGLKANVSPSDNLLNEIKKEHQDNVCKNKENWMNCASVAVAVSKNKSFKQVKDILSRSENMIKDYFEDVLKGKFNQTPKDLESISVNYARAVYTGARISGYMGDHGRSDKWDKLAGHITQMGAVGYIHGTFVKRYDLSEMYFNSASDKGRAHFARNQAIAQAKHELFNGIKDSGMGSCAAGETPLRNRLNKLTGISPVNEKTTPTKALQVSERK